MKYFTTILTLIIFFTAFGQEKINSEERGFPIIMLVIKSEKYEVDEFFALEMLNSLNPRWIKKMEIVKDEKYSQIFGNQPPKAILIYPKRRYYKKILSMLNENTDTIKDEYGR